MTPSQRVEFEVVPSVIESDIIAFKVFATGEMILVDEVFHFE
jgi:hypothetical protein